MSPGRAGVCRESTAASWRLAATGKLANLPSGELERAGDQHDHSNGDRNSARQRGPLHLDCRQCDAERKDDDSDMFYDLGVAHTKLAQYDAAAAAFSKSLELDPDNYRAQDGLDDAKEGIKRIRAGRKHNEDLLKKQKEDELKKAGASPSPED